jgi:sec-independent protein translocase protein TatA
VEVFDVFGTFGVAEILLIALIAIFFFGAKRIPTIARGLGEGIRNFRASVREGSEDEDETKRLQDGSEADQD